MPLLSISNADDPRLADYRNIPDPELLERHGVFVAEGRLVVRRLIGGRRHRVRSVMVTETARAALEDVLGTLDDVPIFVVPLAVMTSITGFNIHRGCLAIAERPTAADPRSLVESATRLIVLERVANADNVGSVFRNAAAFGMQGVLLGPSCADPLYRKAIRTSMGASLFLPFAHAEPWPDLLGTLRGRGVHVLGLTPAGTLTIEEAVRRIGAGRAAIVLGHEGEGLSAEATAACTLSARIPMAGGADSLNVATAGAIAMYEVARARRGQAPALYPLP